MSFDFSTLITDRTQADVTKKAAKGFYNASDLNRVTACMEYLDEEIRKLGYESGYQRVRIERPEPPPTSRLPDGYTELEYIESTGTQYIDTGFKPNQNTRVTMDAKIVSITNTSQGYFGERGLSSASDKQAYILWTMQSGANISSDYFGTRQSQALSTVKLRVQIDKDKNICVCNGLTLTNQKATGQGVYTLYLFGVNDVGVFKYGPKMQMFQCQIYDNGVLIRTFIPCKNQSGETGLYDMVESKFYGNAGAGTFTPGPEIVPYTPTSLTRETLDPYLWYDTDTPTAPQMAQYLANVAALRAVFTLPDGTPQTPQSMALLTFAKANDIESVLQYVETTIQQTVKGMARSNSFTFWSGNRPFPTAYSNKGRDWDGLDEMRTGWRNWQLATWYLLLYGNLKAEGDVS